MRVIYCRGNRIEVGRSGRFGNSQTVRLEAQGVAELTPDSARSLAVALIEHAAHVERCNGQKGAS